MGISGPFRSKTGLGVRASLALALAAVPAGCASGSGWTSVRIGHNLFDTAFNPDRNFAGDLRPSSDDQLILTAAASNRDEYAPAYSLALAYRCLPTNDPGLWQCRYVARMLRVGPPGEAQIDASFRLLARAQAARGSDPRPMLAGAGLQWLEANVNACEGGIHAMDSIRVADWRPDPHYELVPMEQREVISHPAMIRVRMTGSLITSRYQGWVMADGVPAAVRRLLEVLEPCWRPAASPPPWERRLHGRRP